MFAQNKRFEKETDKIVSESPSLFDTFAARLVPPNESTHLSGSLFFYKNSFTNMKTDHFSVSVVSCVLLIRLYSALNIV